MPWHEYKSIHFSAITNNKGAQTKRVSIKLLRGTMTSMALLILLLTINILRLHSYLVTSPSCSNNNDCTTPNYLSAKFDPEYEMSNEQLRQFTFNELHSHLDCYAHAKNQSKPLYTMDMYAHMRHKYIELTGESPPPLGKTNTVYHIGKSEDAGRGIFASKFIAQGTIIPFDESCIVVTFTNGTLWKEYVASLPRDMACDVMEWTWIQSVHTVDDIRLCLSIGDGDSFLNDADVDEDVNIAPVDLVSMKFVAVRDIQEGEELIYDVSF